MANKTIDQLPAGSIPVDTDLFVLEQSVLTTPSTNKVTALQVSEYVTSGITGQYLPLTGGTLTGPLFVPIPTGVGDPESTQVVPYQDVQQQASYNGTKRPVQLASTTDIFGTYYNGPANNGEGATLTNNGTLTQLVLDGIGTVSGVDRVLLKDQASNNITNGIYDVINQGSSTEAWLLRRTSDFDNSADGQIGPGALGFITLGVTQADALWALVTIDSPVVIGTDPILFHLVNSGGNVPITGNAGQATLVSGTVAVSYPAMDDSSIVLATVQIPSGTQGFLSTPTTAGIGFTINSTSSSENSVVGWEVLRTLPLPVSSGSVTLSAGNATVSSVLITSTAVIILSIRSPVNSNGKIVVASKSIGTSFSITSGYGADTSVIDWAIYDAASLEANSTVTLSAGAATVSYPALASGDIILLTVQSPSGTLGDIAVNVATPGTGFTITSNSAIDTSIIGWVVYPAASVTPHGTVTLASGAGLATNSNVQNSSVILMTCQVPGTLVTFGNYAIGSLIPTTSFVINSNSPIDTSIVGYVILN